MTLGRLVLAAALGMALTGLAVYALTAPTVRPPVVGPGPTPEASAPLEDAPGDSAAERDDLAELQQEIERLRALLDAAAPVEAGQDAADDASPTQAGARPVVESTARRVPPPVAGFCTNALSERELRAFLVQVPALRELPPEKLDLLRRGSLECACAGDERCASWCGSKGLRSGRCVAGKCQCL